MGGGGPALTALKAAVSALAGLSLFIAHSKEMGTNVGDLGPDGTGLAAALAATQRGEGLVGALATWLYNDALDAGGGLWGTLVNGLAKGLYGVAAGLVDRDVAKISEGAKDLTASAMPRLGNSGGWRYGVGNSSPLPDSGTRPALSSFEHDIEFGKVGGLVSQPYFSWISNTWTGPGSLPGPYGLAYSVLGTIGFGIPGGVLWALGR